MQIYNETFHATGLELSEISLIPIHKSTITSRSQDSLDTTSILFPNVKLTTPIVASPMKDVCDGKVAKIMRELGGYGIIHRFLTIEEQVNEYKIGGECGCAIGINGDYIERFSELYRNGCRNFCIDVANGANVVVEKAIIQLTGMYQDVYFIVGNVASSSCFQWVSQLPNITGIRVGIAGGAGCTTRNATGVYHPMASLIDDCYKNKWKGVSLIADGGIKESQDFCKSIALGADCIMVGSLIAKTLESPAQFINKDGKQYKIYNGSASYEIQKTYKEVPKYIEGRSVLLDYKHDTLKSVITQFMDGLTSSMSYLNARTLQEFRNNAWVCVLKK